MLWLASLLAGGALAVTDPPTVPTPYPTITPAPESQCNYGPNDQGPFALDCLQAEFLARGCSMRGESYPTDTFDDNDSDTDGGDNDDRDKDWYNNNDNSWSEVQAAIDALAADTGNTDCFGQPTPEPTQSPTETPTTDFPTPSPSRAPTTLTPAPTYAEDPEFAVTLTSNGGAAADLKASCEAAGFARQYDDNTYVLRVSVGAPEVVDYYTVGAGDEICDIFDGTADALVGTSADGPFQLASAAGNRANGVAHLDMTAGGTTIKIASKRNYSQCREIQVPFDDGFNLNTVGGSDEELADVPCSASDVSQMRTAKACSEATADNLEVALLLANELFLGCSATCLYGLDGAAAYSWGSGCWDSDASACTDSDENAYGAAMAGMLCPARCDYTTERYLAETGSCFSVTSDAAGVAGGSCTASLMSPAEGALAAALCGQAAGASDCYVGNTRSGFEATDATWNDGTQVDWTNFVSPYKNAGYDADNGVTQLTLNASTGLWSFNDNTATQPTICKTPADMDTNSSLEDNALACLAETEATGADDVEAMSVTNSYPTLFAGRSGFTNGDEPGELHVVVQVPRTLFEVNMKFENSTNDIAEYQWNFGSTLWTENEYDTGCRADADIATTCGGTEGSCDADCSYHEKDSCGADYEYELAVPWTTFNLGGAGGVQRLQSYQEEDGDQIDPDTDVNDDGSNHKYIFGSTLRIEAKQPIHVDVDDGTEADDPLNQYRREEWTRNVVVRIPLIVKFQKTVHVSTNLDVISTKFNYKTVAAIIQSIQYETQFFQTPYAKIKLQIRTKSQYPYRMNPDVSTAQLRVHMADSSGSTTAGLELEYIADDRNCTFTNPDHMREGDVCTQEWYLMITPQSNVCYATGEYTITYEAACFIGKEVCYMPTDSNGDEITTVSFTFKIQTSKFCPSVVDEVDLAGNLAVTGRNSFRPDQDNLETARSGQLYMQGETLHFYATTSSQRAIITDTQIAMVQVRQNLDDLVQTGYRAVRYDATSQDMVVWAAPAPGRVNSGTVRITTSDGATDVVLMTDDDVFGTGQAFKADSDGYTEPVTADGSEDYEFGATEAGFRMLLHARAMPINVDSFGTKTVAATMEVQYEALPTRRRRRRLLSTGFDDLNVQANVQVQTWQPSELPRGLGQDQVSMSLSMSLYRSEVSRRTARKFAASMKSAMMNGLMNDPEVRSKGKRIYDEQIAIDAIYTDGIAIWQRPAFQGVNGQRRRLVAGSNSQTLRVDFTFARVGARDAVDLSQMMNILKTQVVMPASPLLTQEVFFGAVLHELKETTPSGYEVRDRPTTQKSRPSSPAGSIEGSLREESAASLAVPALTLLAALLALVQ